MKASTLKTAWAYYIKNSLLISVCSMTLSTYAQVGVDSSEMQQKESSVEAPDSSSAFTSPDELPQEEILDPSRDISSADTHLELLENHSQVGVFVDLIAPHLGLKSMSEINAMKNSNDDAYTADLLMYKIQSETINRHILFAKSQYCLNTPYEKDKKESNLLDMHPLDQYNNSSFKKYNRGTWLSETLRTSIQSEYHILGTANGESLDGSQNGDLIRGRDGNDKIRGLGGDDFINGNVGEDDINGNQGNDVLHGGKGDDRILGGKGNDEIHGGMGNDTLKGNDGNDTIRGLDGDDFINGNVGNDFINGNNGKDKLHGGKGDDLIHGGKDNDEIYGDMGNDILIGDLGDDILEGRQGNDTFIFGIGFGTDTFSDDEGEMDAILCEGHYANSGVITEEGNKMTIKFSDNDVLIIQDKTKFEYIDCANLANENSSLFPSKMVSKWIEAIKTKPEEAVGKWESCANKIPSLCSQQDQAACDSQQIITQQEGNLQTVDGLIEKLEALKTTNVEESDTTEPSDSNINDDLLDMNQSETLASLTNTTSDMPDGTNQQDDSKEDYSESTVTICSKDINQWGYSSNCQCKDSNKIYDQEKGKCD